MEKTPRQGLKPTSHRKSMLQGSQKTKGSKQGPASVKDKTLHQAKCKVQGAYYLSSGEYKRILSTIKVPPEENEDASGVVQQKRGEKADAEKRRLELEWNRILKLEQEKEIAALHTREGMKEKAAKERKSHLDHARDLLMENEPEIRDFNRQIMGVMYFPIEKAKLRENVLRKEKFLKEERELDIMVLNEHEKMCKALDEKDEMQRQNAFKAGQVIQQQILQNLEKKKVKDEEIKLEAQQIRERQHLMAQEDLIDLQKKREKAQQFYKEVLKANAENIAAQERKKEEAILADKKMAENIQREIERKAKYEEEQKRIKKEKTLSLAKLWAQQKKQGDEIALKHTLQAQSAQNAKESEWRRKEKELAEKKAQEEVRLKEAHSEQVRCIERQCELEVIRQKEEFEKCLEGQMKEINAEQEKEKQQQEKRMLNLELLREQVRDHELSAEANRRREIESTNKMRDAAAQRALRIDECKVNKLRGIRARGLPDKYISDLARRGGIPVEKCLESDEGTRPLQVYFPLTVRAANKQLREALEIL